MAKVIGYALIIAGYFYGPWFTAAGTAILAADGYEQAKRQKRRARALYNASLQDRLEMVESDPQQPRTIVYGRVRAVEGVRRRWTSGADSQRLTMIVSFAGHEIDGFEQFYFNDLPLQLDGNGYVLTEPYFKGSREAFAKPGTWTGASMSVALDHAPIIGTVTVFTMFSGGEGGGTEQGTVDSVVGNVVTISGGTQGVRFTINYEYATSSSKARIRTFLGTDTQNVGAALAGEYPGHITANDRFAGIALAVVDLDFDPDVFPQGRPNVTAVFRGKKVLDPVTGLVAWTQSPALHAYDYARHRNGWNVPAAEINAADVILARNVCAQTVGFPVGASVVTLPRYQSGIVISTAGDPRDAMNEIMESMAGRQGWAGGVWRMRAGHMPAPVFLMDESWLAKRMQEDGTLESGPTLTFTNGVPRENKLNRVTGSCVDPAQRWQVLPFPAVEDAVLIETEGQVYPLEVEYQAVNSITHAQHLAKVMIKRTAAPLAIDAQCNLHAYAVELFDVGTLTLPSYGIVSKTMEVLGWRWSPMEGPALRMREITQEIFEPVDVLTGRDPAPNTNLPVPWFVETLLGLSVESGQVVNDDGSILTRTQLRWKRAEAPAVRVGGKVETQYSTIEIGSDVLAWQSWEEDGSASSAVIPALRGGQLYVFRARFVSGPPFRVRGGWSFSVVHDVAEPGAFDMVMDDFDFAGAGYGTATARTITVTPRASCVLDFSAKITAKNVLPDAGNQLGWRAIRTGQPVQHLGNAQGAGEEFQAVYAFEAEGGVPITFELFTFRSSPGNPSMLLYRSYIRILQVPRRRATAVPSPYSLYLDGTFTLNGAQTLDGTA